MVACCSCNKPRGVVFPHHRADYFRLGDGAFVAGPLKEKLLSQRRDKMRQHKPQKVTILVLLLLVSLPYPSKAGIPSDQVRQTADKVLLILQDPRLKAADKKKERRDQLRQVISARFDFNEMAKSALGQHWQARNFFKLSNIGRKSLPNRRKHTKKAILLKNPPFILREPQDERRSF